MSCLTISAASDGVTAGLEDGEILSAVKVEPCCSDDDDPRNCRHASVSCRNKRYLTSSVPQRDSSQRDVVHDGLHMGADCFDSVTDTKPQSCSPDVGPVTRHVKRRRLSKDSSSPGPPGSCRYGMFAAEIDVYIYLLP